MAYTQMKGAHTAGDKKEILKAFAEAAKADEALAEKVRAVVEARDAAALAMLAQEAGFSLVEGDFLEPLAELSVEELDAVAGGVRKDACTNAADTFACIIGLKADLW